MASCPELEGTEDAFQQKKVSRVFFAATRVLVRIQWDRTHRQFLDRALDLLGRVTKRLRHSALSALEMAQARATPAG